MQTPNNHVESPILAKAAPSPLPPPFSIMMQATSNVIATEEKDVLSELDEAAKQMIENAFKDRDVAVKNEVEATKVELQISNAKLSAANVDLRQAHDVKRGLQQSRGRALRQLDDMDKILDLTRVHMRFLDGEYKSARKELVEARSVVKSTREEMYELLRAKQKAEQRCRVQEDAIKAAYRTADRLQDELAVEKARVVELETKYGV